MPQQYTEEDVVFFLKKFVQNECGDNKAEAARRLHVTRAYIGDLLLGRRPVSAEIAQKLGFSMTKHEEKFFEKA